MSGRLRGSNRKKGGTPAMVYEGRLYRRGGIITAEMGVDEEGWIVTIGKSVRGEKRRSFGEAVLLPSSIDLHVHFRNPGSPEEVESLSSGSLQAALGGVGAVVDMPNTDPPVTTVERVEEKISRIRSQSSIDVLPYAGLIAGANVAALAKVAAGFKLCLAPTTGNLALREEEDPVPFLRAASKSGLPLHVHAEDPRLFRRAVPARNTKDWNDTRPVESELSAIASLSDHPPGLRLHVAHATSVEAVRRALALGASTEATPHHLLLSASTFGGTFEKVNPPLRPESVRKALWKEFRAGRIPMLSSDHAPHSLARKSRPFAEAPSGLPGVETMVPLMLDRVRRGALPLSVLVRASSQRPALFLGLPRGGLEVGREADFLVVNFRSRRKIEGRFLHGPCGWTPFEGHEGIFQLEHYLQGERIVEGGEFVGGRRGRAIRPHLPGGSRPQATVQIRGTLVPGGDRSLAPEGRRGSVKSR